MISFYNLLVITLRHFIQQHKSVSNNVLKGWKECSDMLLVLIKFTVFLVCVYLLVMFKASANVSRVYGNRNLMSCCFVLCNPSEFSNNVFCRKHYNARFDLPSGHPYSVFLLEDSAFKYTPSHDEVKISSHSRLTNHSLNIKCQLKLHS